MNPDVKWSIFLIDVKIIIGSAGFAAIFSIIAGIFGGASFGTILCRVFFGGIIFAGIGAGAGFVLHKFVPELFEGSDSIDDNPPEPGAGVDIVVDDGDETKFGKTEEDSDAVESAGAIKEVESAESAEEVESAGPAEELESAEELKEDTSEEKKEAALEGGAAADIEEIGQKDESETRGGVDVLPDLNQFDDAFVSVDELQDQNASGTPNGSDTIEIMGEEQDPAIAARAVQTFLKKDQEG